MSRLLLAPPRPGDECAEGRRISAACPWLYLASATTDGTYRLACRRCGSEWPVQAPSAASLQRAVQSMEDRHQEGPEGRCIYKPKPKAVFRRKKTRQATLFAGGGA